MNPLHVYTEYRCSQCGRTINLMVEVYHTRDYKIAKEYALVVNSNRQELIDFEQLHSQHIYNYDFKLEPIGVV